MLSRRFLAGILLVIPILVCSCGQDDSVSAPRNERPEGFLTAVEMRILGFGTYKATGETGVLLVDPDSTTVLPVFVGPCDADVISFGLRGATFPRPLAYDLFAVLLDAVGASVPWILVDVTEQGALDAVVALRAGGSLTQVPAMVSNAIALAQRTGATLFASTRTLEEYAVPIEEIGGLAKSVSDPALFQDVPLTSAAFDTMDIPDSLQVQVLGVLVRTYSTVFLIDSEETVLFPLGIDACQAISIAEKTGDVGMPGPGVHDLFESALDALEIEMVRATIVDMQDRIFIATITFSHRGRSSDLDARPSDSIALSVRTGAPLFILGPLAAQYGIDASEYREEIEMLRGG